MTGSGRSTPFIPRWVILVALLITFIPALSIFLNHSIVRGMIVQQIRAATGLEVGNIRIRLLPRLTVEFSDLIARDDRRLDATIHVPHGSLTLRYLSLLKKQVAIVHMMANEPLVVLRKDREEHWHWPQIGADHQAASEASGGFRVQWLLPDIRLTGGEILILDESGEGGPRELRLRNVNALLESHLFRREAELELTADLDSAGESSGLSLTGSLTMDEGLMAHPAPAAPPPVRFDGAMRIRQMDLTPWVMTSGAAGSSPAQPWRTDLTAQVQMMPGTLGYDVMVSQVVASVDWLMVRGQGRIQHLGTEFPVYAATFSASPVELDQMLRQLPDAWVPPAIRATVRERHLIGTFELISANFNGRIGRGEPANWRGVVKLSQGGGQFSGGSTLIQDLSGTLFLNPAQVEAMDLTGTVGALRVSNGKLVLSHLEVAPLLDLQLTGSGKTGELLGLLRTLGGTAEGIRALKTITDPKGNVQLSMHVAGPLVPTVHLELVKAEMTVHGLGARLPAWNLSAERIDGTVAITPRFIEFNRLRGEVGPISFMTHGAVEMGTRPHFVDLTVEVFADGADLVKFLAPHHLAVDSDVHLGGHTHVVIGLSGPVASPSWKGSMDLTQAEIEVPPIINKARGVVSSVEFDGTMVGNHQLTLRRVALVLPLARMEGRAAVRLQDPPEFSLDMTAGPLPLARLTPVFSVPSEADGVFETSITVKGRGWDWRSWTPSGWVEVSRGRVAVGGLRDRVRDLSLLLQVVGPDVMVDRLSFRAGDSDVTVRGVVKDWARRPVPKFTLESSKLDVTRLIPRDGTSHGGGDGLARLQRWAVSGHAEITAVMKQVQYHRLQFRQVSGQIRIGDGQLEINELKGDTLEGEVSGRLVATLLPQQVIDLEVQMTIDGMPVHQIISVIAPGTEPLRGLMSLTGSLAGRIDPLTPFVGTVRSLGPVTVRLDKGRVLQGRVLPKVLKILNLPTLLKNKANLDLDHDGIPFDKVTATMTAEDGRLTSRNIVFDSPLMKITGAGSLDLVADELDVGLAVSPLGAYSKLIGNIPLFGTLVAGDRPGLTTALFEVKGAPSDPNVRYLPFESIGKGLTGYPRLAIDVLGNVLTLPQKLLAPDTP